LQAFPSKEKIRSLQAPSQALRGHLQQHETNVKTQQHRLHKYPHIGGVREEEEFSKFQVVGTLFFVAETDISEAGNAGGLYHANFGWVCT
jgi:hypothetical protein